MKNEINNDEYLFRYFMIKNLQYILLVIGMILGTVDHVFDEYLNDTTEWLVWLANTFLLMFIGYRTGKFIKKMYTKVYRDPLTRLLNRGYFYYCINNEIEKISSRRSHLSLVMIDIDNFKLVNDTYGHLEGDKVIKNTAYVLKQNIRKTDAAIRWGGDEFTLVLPNTNEDQAFKIADRIREIIEKQKYLANNALYKITVSIGIYTISEKVDQDKLVSIADNALYKAKVKKNSVVVLHL